MRCKDIMTRDVATVTREATVQEAARLMADRDVGFVPIVDDSGAVRGVVTDRDIAIKLVAKGIAPDSMRVHDLMTMTLVTCSPEDDLAEAQRLMSEHKVSRILCVDAQKKPVGVISLQDLTEAEDEKEVGETVREVKEGAATH
jgi:CBS domain-containing protein